MNTACSLGHFPSLPSSPPSFPAKLGGHIRRYRSYTGKAPCSRSNCASRSSLFYTLTRPRPPPRAPSASSVAATEMEGLERAVGEAPSIKLLFVEMGVGYDQHGQDITKAAMRACRDAISSNSIPAFRRGSVPGVNSEQMKLQIKLGVPQSLQHLLDIERVKSVFPYGEIVSVETVNGGMICSSGVCLEAMGDKNDDCYIVNAAVYVGY